MTHKYNRIYKTMDVCGKCFINLQRPNVGVKCCICNIRFHVTCAELTRPCANRQGIYWICNSDRLIWNNITQLMIVIPEAHRLTFTEKLADIYADYQKTTLDNDQNPGTDSLENHSGSEEGEGIVVQNNSNIVEPGNKNNESNSGNKCTNEGTGTKNGDGSNKEVAKTSTGINKLEKIKTENICKFYAKGICKFGKLGAQCTFRHPRKCRNMLARGTCRFGTECRYFHPKLCKFSITEKKCYNLQCPEFHVRGTQRYRREDQYDTTGNFLEADENRVEHIRERNRQIEPLQDHRGGGRYPQDWNTSYQAHRYYTTQHPYYYQNWTNHYQNSTPWTRGENYQSTAEVTPHNMGNHSYLQTYKA